MVQVNEDSLKLNGTRQISVYGDEGDIPGGCVCTIKKTETLLVGRKEIGLEVNLDKTK